MPLDFTINSVNALRKLATLKRNVPVAAENGIKDGGSFLRGKLINETINSPGNAANGGKSPQPPAQPSQGRFIRRRTGALVGSATLKVKAHEVVLYMNTSKASYAQSVADFAIKRYGRSYMQIVLTTYGATVQRIFAQEIGRALDAADKLKDYSYANHYPA